jgi:hypothetical protein
MKKIGKRRLPVVQIFGVKSGKDVKVHAVKLTRVLRKNA